MIDLPKETLQELIYKYSKEDLSSFFQYSWRFMDPMDYIHNWHIDCLCEHLKALESGDIRKLIINVPPRTAKTSLVSIAFPAWLMGRDPGVKILGISYAHRLAEKIAYKQRILMESDFYARVFPNTILDQSQTQKTNFMTTAGGGRFSTSVGGTLTGEGGNYVLLDDPMSPDDAQSEVKRSNSNDWVDQAVYTRLNDPKKDKICCIMQRLHVEDTTGHFLSQDGWHHLKLPAYSEHEKIIDLGKNRWEYEGYLWPDRLDESTLDDYHNNMGAYAFAGQFLQEPAPEGGGEFRKEFLQYYNNHSASFSVKGMNIYIMYDPANSKKGKDPDYTAMVVVGLAPDNNYYVLDLVRDRLNPTERIDSLIELHHKWNRRSGKSPTVVSEQYGMMTDNHYLKKSQDDMNYRFGVVEVGGRVAKEDRIRRLIPLFEGRRIFLPRLIKYTNIIGKTTELVEELIDDEMMTFPVGKHDDMLDAFARLLEKDVYARFPKVKVTRLEMSGGVARQVRESEFDEEDIMTW